MPCGCDVFMNSVLRLGSSDAVVVIVVTFAVAVAVVVVVVEILVAVIVVVFRRVLSSSV